MEDIIKKLRTEATKAQNLIVRQPVIDRWVPRTGHLLNEAADEIEQLRIENEILRHHLGEAMGVAGE